MYIATKSFSGCASTRGEPDGRTGITSSSKIKPSVNELLNVQFLFPHACLPKADEAYLVQH